MTWLFLCGYFLYCIVTKKKQNIMKSINSIKKAYDLQMSIQKKKHFLKKELFEILDAIDIIGAEYSHQIRSFIELYMDKNGIWYFNPDTYKYNDAAMSEIYNEWQKSKQQ